MQIKNSGSQIKKLGRDQWQTRSEWLRLSCDLKPFKFETVTANACKVVLSLLYQPTLFGAAKNFGQPHGHFRRFTGSYLASEGVTSGALPCLLNICTRNLTGLESALCRPYRTRGVFNKSYPGLRLRLRPGLSWHALRAQSFACMSLLYARLTTAPPPTDPLPFSLSQ